MGFQSESIISAASQRYGVIDYSRWQAIRWQWYSYVLYPTAGVSELNFFGQVPGQTGVTLQDTNLPKAGSFGQTHFLLKSISTDIKIPVNNVDGFTRANQATLDTQALASDYIGGFVQAGVLTLSIGSRPFATIPKPFQYAPPPGSPLDLANSFVNQISAAPVPAAGAAQVVGVPWVTQTKMRSNVYFTDPNILIEAEQQFNVQISFPSDAVPVIATAVANDTTNPLKVGIVLDGVKLQPVQ
ncbi:MAG: hypothetical protein EBU84_00745 [Actinobacteria bacterium]|nr:hypothetical protein [Actinomycetota bacterium]